MGGATTSYATSSVALRIIWPCKTHHYVKVVIPWGGGRGGGALCRLVNDKYCELDTENKALQSSETSVTVCQLASRNFPEDVNSLIKSVHYAWILPFQLRSLWCQKRRTAYKRTDIPITPRDSHPQNINSCAADVVLIPDTRCGRRTDGIIEWSFVFFRPNTDWFLIRCSWPMVARLL
jgi:hypothetical protein